MCTLAALPLCMLPECRSKHGTLARRRIPTAGLHDAIIYLGELITIDQIIIFHGRTRLNVGQENAPLFEPSGQEKRIGDLRSAGPECQPLHHGSICSQLKQNVSTYVAPFWHKSATESAVITLILNMWNFHYNRMFYIYIHIISDSNMAQGELNFKKS